LGSIDLFFFEKYEAQSQYLAFMVIFFEEEGNYKEKF